jgi:hypothetical protein
MYIGVRLGNVMKSIHFERPSRSFENNIKMELGFLEDEKESR